MTQGLGKHKRNLDGKECAINTVLDLTFMSSHSLRGTRHINQLLRIEVSKQCKGIIQEKLRSPHLHRGGEKWAESFCARSVWSDEGV